MRVAIVDDAAWLRGLMVDNLETLPGVRVVISVPTGDELLAALRTTGADLAIIDLKMPPSEEASAAPAPGELASGRYEGLNVAARVHARHPRVGLLILTNAPDLFSARRLDEGFPAVGRGYWSKDAISSSDELAAALATIAGGGVTFEPRFREQLDRLQLEAFKELTRREWEVLRLMHAGITTTGAIADELVVAESTVKKHRENIYRKLGVTTVRAPEGSDPEGRAAKAADAGGQSVKAVLLLERYLASSGER